MEKAVLEEEGKDKAIETVEVVRKKNSEVM